jgi:alkaline phosphatase D
MQKLLRACPHYAIWDDHDFGPNDSNGSWIHKDRSQKAFELFWANNSYGFGGDVCTAGAFTFGDVDVFLLDNRTFRTHPDRKDVTPQILGNDQISWLIESLQTSKAPFKLVAVGGQFISDFAKYETHAMFPEERDKILALLDTHNIEGVIVLTGDRHHTELSSLTFDDGRVVYDLTASPLTSTSYDHAHETNSNRVDGTIVGERNFVALSFSGDRKDRTLTMQCFNVGGKLMWSKEIKEGELRSNRE